LRHKTFENMSSEMPAIRNNRQTSVSPMAVHPGKGALGTLRLCAPSTTGPGAKAGSQASLSQSNQRAGHQVCLLSIWGWNKPLSSQCRTSQTNHRGLIQLPNDDWKTSALAMPGPQVWLTGVLESCHSCTANMPSEGLQNVRTSLVIFIFDGYWGGQESFVNIVPCPEVTGKWSCQNWRQPA
jgi:hypothetical protein